MMQRFLVFILCTSLLYSCALFKSKSAAKKENPLAIELEPVDVTPQEKPVYRESAKRVMDLLHTRLEVSFDWKKQYLYGKATITLKPYFYASNKLILDARGMEIKEVSLIQHESHLPLQYEYNDKLINITLDKEYTRNDTLTVFIDYVAKPNELKINGSAAISSDKGLYFINADSSINYKPTQVWTQGETQSNSAWFPTIDRPNERMTNEIYITVDKRYTTLSNGELNLSFENADGTRTDHWKMDLPHAPYLMMMAVGDFSIVKDKWHGKEVSYYVEKKYAPYARAIFGNTPEMLSFFSKRLGVDYPWVKYSQVVVRDYVSGAMENTSATLHGEFLQKTSRELLDGDLEEIISHELFHQWFGDLVTCESWSNLALNESFATYGEYLWAEYKYGRDAADYIGQQDQNRALAEDNRIKEPITRFHYREQEELFDGLTYQKGGRVLHMLRKYLGDEAFFEGLRLYLEQNKFNAVELAHLRLAFEKVSGEDLHWFFNEWFLTKGHPHVTIKTAYIDSLKKVEITLKQSALEPGFNYRLPLAVDIYRDGKKTRELIVFDKAEQRFLLDAASKPDLVNVDAEKILIGTKSEQKPKKDWAFQYSHAPLYLDRWEALTELGKEGVKDSVYISTLRSALQDPFWAIRHKALIAAGDLLAADEASWKPAFVKLATNDPKSAVREKAIQLLSANSKDRSLLELYKKSLEDSSYNVMGEALEAIVKLDESQGLKLAKKLEAEKNEGLLISIMGVYAKYGSNENLDFFLKSKDLLHGYKKSTFLVLYADFLKRCDDETIMRGLGLLEETARTEKTNYVRYYAQRGIKDLVDFYSKKEQELKEQINTMKSTNPNAAGLSAKEERLKKIQTQKLRIEEVQQSVMKKN